MSSNCAPTTGIDRQKEKLSNQNNPHNVNMDDNKNNWRRLNDSSSKNQSCLISNECEPWNRHQFLQRVSTFTNVKWFGKPSEISALKCARYGWECNNLNQLRCSSCNVILHCNMKLNINLPKETAKSMTDAFAKRLQSGHIIECPWKGNPCDESFEYLSNDSSIMKQELFENIESWAQEHSNKSYYLPRIEKSMRNEMIQWVTPIPDDDDDDDDDDNDHNNEDDNNDSWLKYPRSTDVLLLAASGWYLKPLIVSSSNLNNLFKTEDNNEGIENAFMKCRYCNQCVSVANCEFDKLSSLLPPNMDQLNEMNEMNEMNEINDNNERNENKMEIDSFNDSENEIEQITSHLANKLSKLGLKLESADRSHRFSVYPTQSLQQSAQFLNSPNKSNKLQNSMKTDDEIDNETSYLWPRRSVFSIGIDSNNFDEKDESSMMNVRIDNNIKLNDSSNLKRKSRKRNRSALDQDMMNIDCKEEMESRRKRTKLMQKKEKEDEVDEVDEEEDDEEEDNDIYITMSPMSPIPFPRENKIIGRKRKTLDNDGNNDNNENDTLQPLKRRRLLSNSIVSDNIDDKKRKSRKRKFDYDECDDNSQSLIAIDKPLAKRQRLIDANNKINNNNNQFNPILSHTKDCPMRGIYNYQNSKIAGWKYCLNLIPKNVLYLKRIIDQRK